MKVKAIFKFVIAAAIVIACMGENGDENDAEGKLCNDEIQAARNSIQKKIGVCQSEAAAKLESADQAGCIYKCALKMENLMEEDLRLTPESFSKGIGNKVTGIRREILLIALNVCNGRFGSKLNPEETELCLGYEKFGLCLQQGLNKICEGYNSVNSTREFQPEMQHEVAKIPGSYDTTAEEAPGTIFVGYSFKW